MNYFRRFFTLTTGSQSSRRDATGRVVLEARNDVVKTTVFLQDVQEGAYRLVAFSKEGLAADIGAVIINEKGRFDGKFELNRKSVAGSGLAAEDVEGMTIITPPNGTDFSVVLSGFLSEPFPLRANLHFDQPKIAASEIIEDDAEDEVAEMVEEIINEVVLDEIMEEITEDAPETSIEIAEETSEDYVEEIEDVEDNETVEEVELEVQEQAPAPTYPFSDFEHSHKMPPSQNERIDRFFGGRNAVDVFKNHEPKTDWVAASLVDVQNLGLYTDTVKNNELITEKAKQYRHVLLGRTAENRYILGIPDVLEKNHNITAQSGFTAFKTCNPDSQTQSGHGYWIMEL